jgi:hypothetical protein
MKFNSKLNNQIDAINSVKILYKDCLCSKKTTSSRRSGFFLAQARLLSSSYFLPFFPLYFSIQVRTEEKKNTLHGVAKRCIYIYVYDRERDMKNILKKFVYMEIFSS